MWKDIFIRAEMELIFWECGFVPTIFIHFGEFVVGCVVRNRELVWVLRFHGGG